MFITLFFNFVFTKIVEADNRKRAEQSREKAKREAIGRGKFFDAGEAIVGFFDL
jgi:hypothetical protein